MDLAVIGMGRMGREMARRLAEGGHGVTLWNRTPGRAPDAIAAGAREATSIAEAVAGAEAVLVCLADDDAVRAVVLGEGGVAAEMPADAVLADASTVSPALSDELERTVPRFVAMPVLGPPSVVAAGGATYLLGGDPAHVAALEPMVATLTQQVRRYARAELAGAAKLTSNLMLLDSLVALAEAMAVGRAGGLDDDQLRDLLATSPMVAPALSSRFDGVLTGERDTWWTTVLGAKDAGLAVDVAAVAGTDLPLTRAARDQYRRAAAVGLDAQDIAAVGRLYQGEGTDD